MSYRVRYTKAARDDLRRLYGFLLEHDLQAARRARDAIGKGVAFLRDFPFSCRKAAPDSAENFPSVAPLIFVLLQAGSEGGSRAIETIRKGTR